MFHLWDQDFGASANLGTSRTFGNPGFVVEAADGASHFDANLVAHLAQQVPIFIGQGHHGPVELQTGVSHG